MTKQFNPLAARFAIALLLRQKAAAGGDKGVADDLELPTVRMLGPMSDLFLSIARPDEAEPICFVVGLDCTMSSAESFAAEARDELRDGLGFYEDHVLLLSNPIRGAAVGGMLMWVAKAAVGGKARNTPHIRIDNSVIESVEIVNGRPGWDRSDLRFVHLKSAENELWFWIHLPVVTEEELQRAVAGFGQTNA